MQRSRKIIFISLALIFVVPVIIGIFVSTRHTGTAQVSIATVPSDAKISIDNKTVGKRLHLTPSTYTVTASKDGFESSVKSVEVTDKAQDIQFILEPVSDAAKTWAQKNQSLYLAAEGKAGTESQEEGASFEDSNPILKVLPYKNLLFSIDYKTAPNDEKRAIIIISADNSIDRKYALTQIKNWGYQAEDYEIQFKDFSNPLKENQ